MTIRGVHAVARVEWSKIMAQVKTHILLAVCFFGPLAFAVAMRVQASVPADTLFGRSVKESGFAIALVVLGFSALWAFPVLTGVVGGDLFSAEDRYGTWKTLLTRSRSRAEIFVGKVLAAIGFSLLAVTLLAVSSLAAGALIIGAQPLIDLSGILRPAASALPLVALAWMSIAPSALGFTALAILLSVTTRSSAAGIGLPVVAGLTMQLYSFVDGPEFIRRLLLTSGFGAWHGLLSEPPYYGPLIHGTLVAAGYFILSLTITYRVLQCRDIGG